MDASYREPGETHWHTLFDPGFDPGFPMPYPMWDDSDDAISVPQWRMDWNGTILWFAFDQADATRREHSGSARYHFRLELIDDDFDEVELFVTEDSSLAKAFLDLMVETESLLSPNLNHAIPILNEHPSLVKVYLAIVTVDPFTLLPRLDSPVGREACMKIIAGGGTTDDCGMRI